MSDSTANMGSMLMNLYLTKEYSHYPVIFETLQAQSKKGAFGIFCVLFFGGFAFRGCLFLLSYLEREVFDTCGSCDNPQPIKGGCSACAGASQEEAPQPFQITSYSQRMIHHLKGLFAPGKVGLFEDFIRLAIAFVATMIGYALMLAAMTFIILYFFAICLGLSFGEVFFNRLGIVLGLNIPKEEPPIMNVEH